MKVRISRSDRKHKLSAGRIRQALVNATLVREEADAAVYVGTDDEGLADSARAEFVLAGRPADPDLHDASPVCDLSLIHI